MGRSGSRGWDSVPAWEAHRVPVEVGGDPESVGTISFFSGWGRSLAFLVNVTQHHPCVDTGHAFRVQGKGVAWEALR